MTTQTALKECPSCGTRIPEAALRCTSCRSQLGPCTGCRAWLVVGTQCWDCGGGTASSPPTRGTTRTRKATSVASAAEEAPAASVQFDGSPFPLIPLLALRLALFAGFLGALVLALAATPLGPVNRLIEEHVALPKTGATRIPLWAATAGLLIASGFAGSFLRRYRLSRTRLLGKPLASQLTPGGVVLDLLITVAVLGLTAGLGLPWIYARYRRSLYRSFRITARGTAVLDFQGTGEEVLVRFFLTLLLLPLAVATGGLLLGVISWMWLKWDDGNMLVPDRYGQKRSSHFTGTFGAYYGRWLLGWFLTLLSGGLYRPWAKVSEWRWIAQRTEVI
jgi:LPXTG-motif cell wall-anchored protein